MGAWQAIADPLQGLCALEVDRGPAYQVHACSDPGASDALTKTGGIWLVRPVPGTRFPDWEL
jgi:hypothetical protein